MRFKKFCFINPPTSYSWNEIFFPMGPVVLATLLKQEQIPVEILDFDFLLRRHPQLEKDPEAFDQFFLQKLEESGADVFGFSSICSNFPMGLRLAQLVRDKWPAAKIIFGGPQASAVASGALKKFPFIDAIVIGEGERTLVELLQADWNPDSLKQVKGIAFADGDEVRLTPSRPLIEDLDELPFPDFSLVDLPAYLSITPDAAILEAGRGCPFRCTFCSTAGFWSRLYRAKSPGRILEEMRILHRDYGLKFFALTHDNFTTSPKYIRKFCEYFAEHNTEGFTWSSSARTDTLKIPDLDRMAKAGCVNLFYGVDSGSPRTQKAIEKYLDLDGFKEIIQETLDRGIQATASFVLGFPEETPEDLNETILLGMWAKARGVNSVQFHRLTPLASTKIYEENKDRLQLEFPANDFSIPVLGGAWISPYIKNHPDLFSSFYVVPTPHLEDFSIFDFTHFYYVITRHFGNSFQWIFKEKQPTQLYQEWNEFTQTQYPEVSFKNRTRTPDFIENSFAEFL